MKSIVLSRLDGLVTDSGLVSDELVADKWQIIDYETADVHGRMLVAGECTFPTDVELQLNVSGWHKIHLGFAVFGKLPMSTRLEIRLSGEGLPTVVSPAGFRPSPYYADERAPWAAYEWIEESFYKAADLTGQNLIIGKPRTDGADRTAGLAFIRLEPLDSARTAAYRSSGAGKSVMYHFDNDYYADRSYRSTEEYGGPVSMLEHGNAGVLINEISSDDGPIDVSTDVVPYHRAWAKLDQGYLAYLRRQHDVKRVVNARAHAMGLEVYGGNRMAVSDFCTPYRMLTYNSGVVADHPTFRCHTRDGRPMAVLSYAYPEVRKLVIARLLAALADDFDGLSLFFHRGMLLGFEQPVLQRVRHDYDVDARVLRFTDERLNTVLCSFLTEFMCELRGALDHLSQDRGLPRYKLNVVGFFDLESGKNFGLDIEMWAREGLIDSISQGLMTYEEDLTDCMSQEEPYLIDIDRYVKECGRRQVLLRHYSSREERILAGLPDFLRVSREYGIDFYAALHWESKSDRDQVHLAERLYAAGAEKLFCWNANHIVQVLPVLNAIKHAADADRLSSSTIPEFRKLHRVLAVGDQDISFADANWRG